MARYPEYCSVIEWPEGLKVDECVWDPPCQEHQRRARLKPAQATDTTTQGGKPPEAGKEGT